MAEYWKPAYEFLGLAVNGERPRLLKRCDACEQVRDRGCSYVPDCPWGKSTSTNDGDEREYREVKNG